MKTQTLILETKFVLLAFLSTFRFILANNYIQRHSIYKFNMVNEDVVAMSNSDSNVLTTFISKNTTTTLIINFSRLIANSKKEITLVCFHNLVPIPLEKISVNQHLYSYSLI